jgi:hypothetical protein
VPERPVAQNGPAARVCGFFSLPPAWRLLGVEERQ